MQQLRVSSLKEIGQVIRAERKARKLNQTMFAAYCGVGRRYLSDLENGKETIEAGRAIEIINLLGFIIRLER